MTKRAGSLTLTLFLLALASWTSPASAGSLQFFASGEELATDGFQAPELTRDGWAVEFRHIYVTLDGITGYRSEPPFDPHTSETVQALEQVRVAGVRTIDLVAEADEESRVLVAESPAGPGHYNAISWRMVAAGEGPAAGTSMLLIGTATQGDRNVPFQIAAADEVTYLCGEYVGDERKGFVQKGETGDLEITFHLDHIFGRADKDPDDPINIEAPGFAPFSTGPSVIALGELHVGHAGEGHCRVQRH